MVSWSVRVVTSEEDAPTSMRFPVKVNNVMVLLSPPIIELPSVLLNYRIPNASELMAGELIDAVELKTPTNA